MKINLQTKVDGVVQNSPQKSILLEPNSAMLRHNSKFQ